MVSLPLGRWDSSLHLTSPPQSLYPNVTIVFYKKLENIFLLNALYLKKIACFLNERGKITIFAMKRDFFRFKPVKEILMDSPI